MQYVLIKGETNNYIAIERSDSVISKINNAGIQTQAIVIVNGNWLKELAKNSIDNLFLRYNGKIEAILSNNDAMAIGEIEALQKYGYNKGDKTKNIAVVGIDGLQQAKRLIDSGFMTGNVIQEPKALAEGMYIIGMNLVDNLNPLENTDYKIIDGEIIIPIAFEEYIKKR